MINTTLNIFMSHVCKNYEVWAQQLGSSALRKATSVRECASSDAVNNAVLQINAELHIEYSRRGYKINELKGQTKCVQTPRNQ